MKNFSRWVWFTRDSGSNVPEELQQPGRHKQKDAGLTRPNSAPQVLFRNVVRAAAPPDPGQADQLPGMRMRAKPSRKRIR